VQLYAADTATGVTLPAQQLIGFARVDLEPGASKTAAFVVPGEASSNLISGRKIRCAIYTRKSSEEGLEQEFNSLDAQREACEAFVRSQRHEGRPETVACAGTGLGNCLFRWKREKTVIEIVTVGEDNPTVTFVNCKANCL